MTSQVISTTGSLTDKGVLSLPQLQYLELLIKQLCDPNALDEIDDECDITLLEQGKIAFDIIIENQRGTKLFGMPFFSNNSLIPYFDPPSFQTLQGKPVDDLKLFPLADFHWKWSWLHWTILMIGDVDVDGFVYTRLRFNSRHWKGVFKIGDFARRRVWIRKRERDLVHGQSLDLYRLRQEATNMVCLAHRHSLANIMTNSSQVTDTDASTIYRNGRKRDKLKKMLTRRRSKMDNDDQIELFIDDSSIESSFDAFDEEQEEQDLDSVYESIILEDPIEQFFTELDQLKLDREKISKFLNLISNFDSDFWFNFINENSERNLIRLLNSLDHDSSRFVLLSKLKVLESQCVVTEPIRLLICKLETLC